MNEEIRNKGWSQMKELLDREMPVKRTGLIPFYYIRAAAGVVLLIIAGMVYMGMPYFQNYESTAPLTEVESTSTEIKKTTTVTANDSPLVEASESFSENENLNLLNESNSSLANNQSESEDGLSSIPSSTPSPNYSVSFSDLGEEMGNPKAPTKAESVNIDLQAQAIEMTVDEKISQYTPNPAVLSSPFLSPFPLTNPDLSMNHTAFPKEENKGESMVMIDDKPLWCPSGLAIGVLWKNPSVHSLHGLGLNIGGKKTWEKSALIASIGLTKYGWFGSSGSDAIRLSEGWENEGPSFESEFNFQREYAEELISNYLEVDLEVAWRYYAFPKFSVGPQMRLAKVFETTLKSNAEYRFDSSVSFNPPSNTDGQFLVNSYYLSAGLGLAYDFNCKWGVEFTYQQQLSHFWKEEVRRNNGRGFTLGLGAKMGLNRSN